jgi:hypothetical protein
VLGLLRIGGVLDVMCERLAATRDVMAHGRVPEPTIVTSGVLMVRSGNNSPAVPITISDVVVILRCVVATNVAVSSILGVVIARMPRAWTDCTAATGVGEDAGAVTRKLLGHAPYALELTPFLVAGAKDGCDPELATDTRPPVVASITPACTAAAQIDESLV